MADVCNVMGLSMVSRVFLCLLQVNAFIVLSGCAQEGAPPTIATDRPTVGLPPDVVPTHSLQVESGSNILYNRHGYALDLPETTMRLGLGRRIEARVTSANLMRQSDASTDLVQTQDIGVGTKVALGTSNRLAPQALFFALSIPTGGKTLSSGSYDPDVVLIWQQNIGKGFNVIENAGGIWTTIDGARRTLWMPGLYVSHALSRKITVFAEYAPTISARSRSLHSVSWGVAYNPTPSRQIDVRAGYQDDVLGRHNILSVGYSLRLEGVRYHPNF